MKKWQKKLLKSFNHPCSPSSSLFWCFTPNRTLCPIHRAILHKVAYQPKFLVFPKRVHFSIVEGRFLESYQKEGYLNLLQYFSLLHYVGLGDSTHFELGNFFVNTFKYYPRVRNRISKMICGKSYDGSFFGYQYPLY